MENGIIINNIKYKLVDDSIEDGIATGCEKCSLLSLNVCQYNLLCDIFDKSYSHFEIEE